MFRRIENGFINFMMNSSLFFTMVISSWFIVDSALAVESIKDIANRLNRTNIEKTQAKAENKASGRVVFGKDSIIVAQKIETAMARISKQARDGEINQKQVWIELSKLDVVRSKTPGQTYGKYLQTQAQLLFDDTYFLLSAIYANQAIRSFSDPLNPVLLKSWSILKSVSEKYPIQNQLQELATAIMIKDQEMPKFGSDWFYHVGNDFSDRNEPKLAIQAYSKVKVGDRYYIASRYQLAMEEVSQNHVNRAEKTLVGLVEILKPDSISPTHIQATTSLNENQSSQLLNMTYLALARIYYETKKFKESFLYYRQVSKESPQFYDATFEQAWAFFMGGFPNHTLGAIHSVDSPFFSDRDSPEASMLRALVYFWLCDYDKSRVAVAEFIQSHKKSSDGLSYFLDRVRLTSETSYQMFENLVTGVSGESLGIPRSILDTAATQAAMLHLRDQYANVLSEKRRLLHSGIFRSDAGLKGPLQFIEQASQKLRHGLGLQFLAEVTKMRDSYTNLFRQSRFLEVELLMSEKEHILGNELHASNKMTVVRQKRNLSGWQVDHGNSWSGRNREEYWWDEVGYYIYKERSQCHQQMK